MDKDDKIFIEDHPNMVRDRHSKAILNTDADALKAYKLQRQNRTKTQEVVERVDNLEKKLNLLMDKLDRILDDT